MNQRFPVRSVLAVALVAAAGSLASCGGSQRHGNYTKEGVSKAQERLAQLKSGTEWQMAQQQYLAGDVDKALKTIDKSLTLNPKVPKSHVLRGRILIEKGEIEHAKDAFETALSLEPDNVEAHYFLGIVHERFSMDDKALAYYQRASELEPSNPQYVLASAEMLVNLGRIDDAEQLLLSRKESFGYSAAIRQTLGHIAVLRGQHVKAAEYFNDALLLASDDPAILEDLARSQIACGRFGDAEFNLQRLLRMDGQQDRRDLQMLRAKCLLATDRPVEARSLMQTVINSPDGGADAQAWVELGNAALVLKDRGNLRLAGARVTALAPERFEGHLFRASYLNLESQKNEALVAADNAIARCGGNTAPYLLRASILNDMGKHEEARQTLAAALEVAPNDRAVIAFQNFIDSNPSTTGTPATPAITGVETESNP